MNYKINKKYIMRSIVIDVFVSLNSNYLRYYGHDLSHYEIFASVAKNFLQKIQFIFRI